MGTYLETEQDANEFVEQAVRLKLSQRVDFSEIDEEAQMGIRKDHPVIPDPEHVSQLAVEAASRVL